MGSGSQSNSVISVGSITACFTRVRDGDRAALAPLFNHFQSQLTRLADRTLAGTRLAHAAPDAVQSAFLTFWQRVAEQKFDGPVNRDNLWGILSVITVRKAFRQLRGERTRKRGGDKNRKSADDLDNLTVGQVQHAMNTLTPQEFDLHSEELLDVLNENERPIVILKLMGYTNAESANVMECSKRTIERRLSAIRESWLSVVEV